MIFRVSKFFDLDLRKLFGYLRFILKGFPGSVSISVILNLCLPDSFLQGAHSFRVRSGL